MQQTACGILLVECPQTQLKCNLCRSNVAMTELMHSLFLPDSTKCLASSAHKACTCLNSSCDCSGMMNLTESMYFTAPRVTLYATFRQHSCATDKTRRSRPQSPIALTCAMSILGKANFTAAGCLRPPHLWRHRHRCPRSPARRSR